MDREHQAVAAKHAAEQDSWMRQMRPPRPRAALDYAEQTPRAPAAQEVARGRAEQLDRGI